MAMTLPPGANAAQHLMLANIALPVLKKLGLIAVNLANNHAYDFGAEGAEQTMALVESAGIKPLRHDRLSDLGPIRVLPLTFKRGYFFDHPAIRTTSQLDKVCNLNADHPLIVLPHWGPDYSTKIGEFESEVLDKLNTCGVSAVIGAHSHLASRDIEVRSGGAFKSVFSMGNLIFDQTGPQVSGALSNCGCSNTAR